MSEPIAQAPAQTPNAVRTQRRWLVLPFVVFGLLAVAYLATWFKARDVALQRLGSWVAAEKARGVDVRYDSAKVIGLPFRFALEIENLQRTESGGKYWKAAGLRINALPYDLKHVIVEALGKQTFRFADGRVWTLTADSAAMSVHWNKKGLLRLSAIAKNVAWKSEDGASGALQAYALQITPTDKSQTALRFQTEGVGGRLPKINTALDAFGPDFKSISARGSINQAQTFAMGFTPAVIDLWSSRKGNVKLEEVKVLWGAANLKGAGSLNLDRMRRPAGTLTLSAPDGKALAEFLRAKGWPDESPASKALSGPVEIPLLAVDGEVYFWGAPLKDLRPLYTPDIPDAAGAPIAGG